MIRRPWEHLKIVVTVIGGSITPKKSFLDKICRGVDRKLYMRGILVQFKTE